MLASRPITSYNKNIQSKVQKEKQMETGTFFEFSREPNNTRDGYITKQEFCTVTGGKTFQETKHIKLNMEIVNNLEILEAEGSDYPTQEKLLYRLYTECELY